MPTSDRNPAPADRSMLADRIRVARGLAPCDRLLRNVRLVNVFTREILPCDGVAIHDGEIVGFGADREARETEDLGGAYLAPSFIDGHVHLESSMVVPREFARAVVPQGTGAVVCDPHEIANVFGGDGVRYILEATEGLPLDVYVMVPSCVPATPLETAGASIGAREVSSLLISHPRVIGLAEMMNVPGVLHGDEGCIAKLESAGRRPRDGHAPLVRGNDLSAYILGGIRTDHESTSADEGLDKLRQGMFLQIREGSAAKNLAALLPIVGPTVVHRCMFVTDDRHPHDLLADGHINAVVRDAIASGLSPADAIAIGTYTAAHHYRLGDPPIGAIGPGYAANMIAFDDPATMRPSHVWRHGELVARDGDLLVDLPAASTTLRDGTPMTHSVNIRLEKLPDLTVAAPDPMPAGAMLRVIEATAGSLLTGERRVAPTVSDGAIVPDPAGDLLKLAVVDRHTSEARTGIGFVAGFGLREGALATSVAHDSHNLIAVGATDAAIRSALTALVQMGGGCVVVNGANEIAASLPLPVAGLMTDAPIESVAGQELALNTAASALGCGMPNPFMTLSFLALPPIPALKLTDHGLVDAVQFEVVPLLIEP